MKKPIFFIFIVLTYGICAQSSLTPPAESTSASQGSAGEAVTYKPVPDGFNDIKLGISLEQAKEVLKNNDNFYYRGDPDVSFMDKPNTSSLDVEGRGYVSRGIFQFSDDKLYVISIFIDTDFLDHYAMFVYLTQTYGPPDDFSPEKSVWNLDDISMSLERPLNIKYIDENIFAEIVGARVVKDSLESDLRRQFIEQF